VIVHNYQETLNHIKRCKSGADIGGHFCVWMNRPIRKVNVFTNHLLYVVYPNNELYYRIRLPYRDEAIKDLRRKLAAFLRTMRRKKVIELPVYNESNGEYMYSNGFGRGSIAKKILENC
jgi:hypothetical protein